MINYKIRSKAYYLLVEITTLKKKCNWKNEYQIIADTRIFIAGRVGTLFVPTI